MFKKIISAFLISVTLFISTLNNVYAAEGDWYNPTYNQFIQKVEGGNAEEIFGERYTFAQVHWIIYSLQYMLSSGQMSTCLANSTNLDSPGSDILTTITPAVNSCAEQIIQPPTANAGTSSFAFNNTSGLGPILGLAFMADKVRTTSVVPTASQQIASSLNNLHIVPEANAQGFGFNTLHGSQTLWGATRNMAYALIVLVFIAFAFMIMLRVKLSPQTVITVQSALPRIIMSLILITFSFAIAGLLIEIAYLIQGVFSVLIVSSGITTETNPINFLNNMNNPWYGLGSLMLIYVVMIILLTVISAVSFAVPIVGTIAGLATGAGSLISLILLVVLFVALLRIIWLYLRTYAVILLLVVLGPLQILWGTINVSGPSGFGSWVRSLAAQLSVFVTSSILIVVGHIFIFGSGGLLATMFSSLAYNPFKINAQNPQASLGSAELPGIGTQPDWLLGFIIGLIVILVIPTIANTVRDTISKPAFGRGIGLGEAFGVPTTGAKLLAGKYVSERERIYGEELKKGTPTAATIEGYKRAQFLKSIMGNIRL